MKVRIQETGLDAPIEIDDVRSVVIYDDFNQPLFLVQKLAKGSFMVTKANDPKFQKCLTALGIGLNETCKVITA